MQYSKQALKAILKLNFRQAPRSSYKAACLGLMGTSNKASNVRLSLSLLGLLVNDGNLISMTIHEPNNLGLFNLCMLISSIYKKWGFKAMKKVIFCCVRHNEVLMKEKKLNKKITKLLHPKEIVIGLMYLFSLRISGLPLCFRSCYNSLSCLLISWCNIIYWSIF